MTEQTCVGKSIQSLAAGRHSKEPANGTAHSAECFHSWTQGSRNSADSCVGSSISCHHICMHVQVIE